MGDTMNDTVYSYYMYNMSDWKDSDYSANYSDVLMQARYSMGVVSMVFFSITFVLGMPGNAFVIWIAGVKMKKTVTTIWYVNLAVADLLCCLAIPIVMSVILLEGHWLYGAAMCKLLFAVFNLNMYASVFTLTMISLDRFTLVIWPVWAHNHRSISQALLLCGLAWFLSLILSLPDLIYNHIGESHYNTMSCINLIDQPVNRAISITRHVFGFPIPLLLMTVCYLFIARRVRAGRFKSQKALRIMVGVVTVFFICWMPYHTNYLVLNANWSLIDVALTVDPLAISLACFNSCLNPVLYLFMGQDFKERVSVSLCRTFENAFREDAQGRSKETALTCVA